VIESLIVVGTIELVRWLRAPVWLQVAAGALFIAALHSFPWRARGLLVAPAFAIEAASYLYWRSSSRRIGYAVIVGIHALSNLIPAIATVANATKHA
jgi:hypothetical protein